MAMALHQLDEPLFAKLAKFVFRLGNAGAGGNQYVGGVEGDGAFVVFEIVEQANDRAAAVQPAYCTVRAEHEGWQLTAIGVEKLAGVGVVVREKQRRVFFRLGGAVEMTVEHAEHFAGRTEGGVAVEEMPDGAAIVETVLAGKAIGAHCGMQ